ncbi:MAG: hypothetical protein P8K80_01780 [Phycisphaerales bacterium]|nr:hypothetical protein [Phycisphaerales bacterium]
MRTTRRSRLVMVPATLVGMLSMASAEVLNVPVDFPTIQEAIDASTDGDEIVVEPGTWTGTGDQVIDFAGMAITLRSSFGPEVTIIDGEGVRRGISCVSGEGPYTVIDGFTITNGVGTWFDLDGDDIEVAEELIAGGLLNWYADPSVVNCIFSNNSANRGGAVYTNFSNDTFTSCTFSGNSAELGGAFFQRLFSDTRLVDCDIDSNSAQQGGGIFMEYGSTIEIVGSSLHGNQADSSGGGIHAKYSTVIAEECVSSYNLSGSSGGALYAYQSATTIDHCAFIGNYSDTLGAAIRSFDSPLTVSDSEFRGNLTYGPGGGIYFAGPELLLTGSSFILNTSGTSGGAASIGGTGSGDTMQISGCAFLLNEASSGGAISFNSICTAEVVDSIVGQNTATSEGGAIINGSALLGIGGTLFCDNDPDTPDDIVGSWSELDPNDFDEDCPTLSLGACCLDDDSCSILPELLCSGTWGGAGTRCEDGCAPCLGDFDGNGTVGVEDLLVVIAEWGPCGGCLADLTGDGTVGVEDLLIIIAQWGPCS